MVGRYPGVRVLLELLRAPADLSYYATLKNSSFNDRWNWSQKAMVCGLCTLVFRCFDLLQGQVPVVRVVQHALAERAPICRVLLGECQGLLLNLRRLVRYPRSGPAAQCQPVLPVLLERLLDPIEVALTDL